MASINGFSVVNYGAPELATFTVPGTSVRLSLRKEMASLMLGFARDFHTTVEPLRVGWCWGHAYRAVTAGHTWSFHSAGIAMDFNAPEHPWKKANTFSAKEREAIHRLLTRYRGAFRWGGNYTTNKDEMHFEIIVSRAQALSIQAAMTARPAPKGKYETYRKGVKPGSRTIRQFNAGDDVAYVQRWVGAKPDDGYFGPATHREVVAYQKMRGLSTDGVVGSKTWSSILGR